MKEIDALKFVLAMAEQFADSKAVSKVVYKQVRDAVDTAPGQAQDTLEHLARKAQNKATSIVDAMIANIENGPNAFDMIKDTMQEEGFFSLGIINVNGVYDDIEHILLEDEDFVQLDLTAEEIIDKTPAALILQMLDTELGKKENDEIAIELHNDLSMAAAKEAINRYIDKLNEGEPGG